MAHGFPLPYAYAHTPAPQGRIRGLSVDPQIHKMLWLKCGQNAVKVRSKCWHNVAKMRKMRVCVSVEAEYMFDACNSTFDTVPHLASLCCT